MNKLNRIVIGADDFGVELKNTLAEHLRINGYEVVDMGVHDSAPVDYPDIAVKVAIRNAARAAVIFSACRRNFES